MKLRKLQDVNLKGKKVLMRVDHNVVKKGVIKDPYRIDASLGKNIFNESCRTATR
jgi:phosphoglycerate kinase